MQIKNFMRDSALACVSILVTLVLVELIIWISPLKVFVPFLAQPRPYYVASSEYGFDIGVNKATTTHVFSDGEFDVWSNELGCYDYPYQGEDYLYLTGDSFAWGFADFSEKWGTLLEKELGRRVLKCGVDGYGTRQELLKTKQILSHLEKKPEYIIVSYLGANDIDDDLAFPHYSVIDNYRVPLYQGVATNTVKARMKRFMTAHSGLYNMSKNSISKILSKKQTPRATTTQGYTEAQYAQNFEHISQFISLATSTQATLVIVLVPSKTELQNGQTPHNDKLREYLQRYPMVKVIDLFPEFKSRFDRGEELYWTQDGHWNEAGNAVAAELIASWIASSTRQN